MLEPANQTGDEAGPGPLTPRETEVLAMLAEGRTNVDMARTLGVSVHAVKFHLASIYRKLGVSNRTEAAVTYLRGSRARSLTVGTKD